MRQVKTRGKDGEIKCTAVDKTFVLDRFHTWVICTSFAWFTPVFLGHYRALRGLIEG
jgi:hypothetical protein